MYELIIELAGKGTRWNFAQLEIRVGRDPNCDLILATEDYPMVSRSHLLIRQAADRYWAEDLNTLGGTFVNGEQIQVAPLSNGDVIQLGTDGPQLHVHVGAARRVESMQIPSRRSSSSEEAPTRGKGGDSPEGAPGEVSPVFYAPPDETPQIRIARDDSGEAAEFPKTEPAPEPVMPPGPAAESAAVGNFRLAPSERISTQDAAVMKQKLNQMRTTVILMAILVAALGGMILYIITKK